MRILVSLLSAIVLVACETPVPDSGVGVGFDGYDNYNEQREARLDGRGTITLGAEISDETVASGQDVPTIVDGQTAAQEEVATSLPDQNSAGISDEQDFDAVSLRESIQSDAERRDAQQNAYQVIAPTALPTRDGKSGATVVEFALSTTNRVGQALYKRTTILAANRFQRNCAKYSSADRAQEAFLKAGGPKRDPKGIDPDGDGFACYWDPAPYRLAVGN